MQLPDKISPLQLFIGLSLFATLFLVLSKVLQRFRKYKPRRVALPTGGQGIPIFTDGTPWSPLRSVEMLYEAMFGSSAAWYNPWAWGTDEKTLFLVLGDKTQDQLAALLNFYEEKYQRDLIADFKTELSGADLSRALDYFAFISA